MINKEFTEQEAEVLQILKNLRSPLKLDNLVFVKQWKGFKIGDEVMYEKIVWGNHDSDKPQTEAVRGKIVHITNGVVSATNPNRKCVPIVLEVNGELLVRYPHSIWFPVD
jgi:hypothetical protein